MPELWLIRHAESTANVKKLVTGDASSPLTSYGEKQAHLLGCFLKKYLPFSPSKIITSCMDRATQTAKILNLSDSIESFSELNELDAGTASNEARIEFDRKNPDFWNSFDPYRQFPNGESHMDLYYRVNKCVDHLLSEADAEEKLVMVVHAGTISSIFHKAYNIPMKYFSRFVTKNASISAIKYNKEKTVPELLFFNIESPE